MIGAARPDGSGAISAEELGDAMTRWKGEPVPPGAARDDTTYYSASGRWDWRSSRKTARAQWFHDASTMVYYYILAALY